MSLLDIRTVNGRRTATFDHYSIRYADHWQEMAREIHASGPPIAWVDSHDGGYWLVASADALRRIGTEWDTFTSVNDLDGSLNGGRGQRIPQKNYRLFLGESDPPEHTARRALEVPFFAPKPLRRWRPVARHYLHEAIDRVVESGRCELTNDVLIPTAARTTLYVLGYDPNDYQDAASVAHLMSYLPADDPNYPNAEADRLRVNFRAAIVARQGDLRGDILSSLARATNEGTLGLNEAESMVNALVFGGFDTTSSLVANALVYFDQNPEIAERFQQDPAARRNIVEELLRFHPPGSHMSRTAVRPTELLGQTIKPGERVMMWLAAANRDPAVFDDPDRFDPDRPNAREHLSFSTGHHRCLGAPLAKVEAEEMLSIIPQRLGQLRIERDDVIRYPNLGGVNGFVQVPATFTPGHAVHSVHPDLTDPSGETPEGTRCPAGPESGVSCPK